MASWFGTQPAARVTALLYLVCALLCPVEAVKRYDGYAVVSVNHTEFPRLLSRLAVHRSALDVWSSSATASEVMLRPQELRYALGSGIGMDVVVDDVQRLVDAEQRSLGQNEWFKAYHPLSDIKEWFQELAAQHQSVSFQEEIGKSVEGRSIFALRFGEAKENKPQVYVQSLQHAREWISGAATQYLARHLVTTEEGKALLEAVEIVLVPVANPDGYAFSWTNERLWRKNRRLNSGGSYGVGTARST